MKLRLLGRIFLSVAAMTVLPAAFGQSALVSSVALEGQNKGNTNTWSGGNLMGWQELDFIPCRVFFTGSGTSQSVTLTFPHLSGTTPGFENFYNFTSSPNVSFVSAPVLSAPANGNWSYTFTVNVTNSGSVNFFARLAAGAHLNVGSSLQIGGSPQSMGQLQIHKPQPGAGAPDLAVVKTGSVTVPQGGAIIYTLTYTNKATGTNAGVGVQLSDILPPGVTIDTNALPSGANYAGNTIFFDLPNLPPHAGGQVTFPVGVPLSIPAGTVLTNFAQILSSQDDANPQDNTSTWQTTVTAGCTNLVVSAPPANQVVCPGDTAVFSVEANGTALTYQWYNGAELMSGQTSNTLSLANVGALSAGTYSVIISDLCGDAVTNSATLMVNSNTLISVSPIDQTVCPGQVAQFSVSATGTDLIYQWYYGNSQLSGETSNVLTLSGITEKNAGTYSVVIMGACGTTVTNSAVLAVNQSVSVAPLPNVTNLIGGNAVFMAVASGTGPFAYQWYQGSNPLPGQTNSTLILNNLQPANGGSYSVSVTGQCGNAATAGFILTIDLPPVVSITYPTNGQVFIDPATFNVLASASDPDGTVTNVQFFSSTDGTNFTSLGQTNNTPYLTIASNLPPGSYTFMAIATDNLGASAQSAPVTVQVVPTEPATATVIGNVTLNLQDGYQWLSNVVCNPVNSHPEAVRVYIHNITNSTIRVVNASGTNNGVPYVESPAAIQPGTCWTNVIMFYDPYGVQFSPTLTVEMVDPPDAAGNPAGVVVPMLPAHMLHDGTFLVEFASTNGATYYVQYSSDMVNWSSAFPAITGTGQHMQWIDSGPPATISLPAANVQRFYRVIQAQ